MWVVAEARLAAKTMRRRLCIVAPPARLSIAALIDERVAVEFLDGRRLLDEALGQVEILQALEALRVDFTELRLPRIDQLGVVVERRFHRAFLTLPLGHEAHEIVS